MKGGRQKEEKVKDRKEERKEEKGMGRKGREERRKEQQNSEGNKQEIEYMYVNHGIYVYHNSSSEEHTN